MDPVAVFLVSIGLSMDCVAVAMATSLEMKGVNANQAVTMGAFFGGFQALMPILGWMLGASLVALISVFDHWIAFGLLTAIGLKMIYEAFRGGEVRKGGNRLQYRTLTLMAVVTSIDALAVGLSYSLLGVSILVPALLIGVVCFSLSSAAALVAGRLGAASGKWARLLGGSVLIMIGLRILVEHIFG